MEPDDEIHRLRVEFERNQIMNRAYANGVIPTVIPDIIKFEGDDILGLQLARKIITKRIMETSNGIDNYRKGINRIE